DEVVGAGVPVLALLAGASERGAYPVDEHDVRTVSRRRLGHDASRDPGTDAGTVVRIRVFLDPRQGEAAALESFDGSYYASAGGVPGAWRASTNAAAMSSASCSTCQGRAPSSASAAPMAGASSCAGGLQATRRRVSGVRMFSSGMASCSARSVTAARASLSRRSA